MATTPRTKRDVSRALALATDLSSSYGSDEPVNVDSKFEELIEILVAVDARTGRRDPSKRRKPAAKKAAKKASTRRSTKRAKKVTSR